MATLSSAVPTRTPMSPDLPAFTAIPPFLLEVVS